jgi:hypothetical protein
MGIPIGVTIGQKAMGIFRSARKTGRAFVASPRKAISRMGKKTMGFINKPLVTGALIAPSLVPPKPPAPKNSFSPTMKL